jgi:cytochrome c553
LIQKKLRMQGMAIPNRAALFVAAAGAAIALSASGAISQTALIPAEELRPVYANVDDIRDGKELADTTCSKCHGPAGVSATEGVPNLAGQRPVYLYRELKAYKLGDRPVGSDVHNMRLMKFFSDEALAKVAAYYASLEPAPPPEGAPPKYVDPVAAGKEASAGCAKCHGDNGVSHKEGVPSLIGLNPKYLVDAMQAYKEGDRPTDEKNADMKKALEALSDVDLQRVALYYASQSENLTRAQTPNPGGAPLAKELLAVCAKCHGETGISTGAATPNLAGQDATYMLNALRGYKDGVRDDDTMSPKAKKLDDVEMKTLAAYYAALDPKPVNIPKPLSPDEWAERCDRCHGLNGNSMRPDAPSLAGQRADYLEKVLKAYQKGARKSPEMAAMSSILNNDDIAGIATHYAFQKGRAVVFIMVPEK